MFGACIERDDSLINLELSVWNQIKQISIKDGGDEPMNRQISNETVISLSVEEAIKELLALKNNLKLEEKQDKI